VAGLKIGSDPEGLIIRSDGRFVSAERLLGYSTMAEIGTDGHSFTLELRPKPGTPAEHHAHIQRLLFKFKRQYPNHNILAGSFHTIDNYSGEPIGGHIHFSRDYERGLVRRLDWHLAVPILAVESPRMAQRRRRNYGGLHSWREQPHGFEYRVLPSWLVSYGMAKTVLNIAWLIAHIYDKLPEPPVTYNGVDIVDMFRYTPEHVTTIRKAALSALNKLAGFREAKYCGANLDIASLKSLILLNKTWQQERPILSRWNLERYRPAGQIDGKRADYRITAILNDMGADMTYKFDYYLYGLRPSMFERIDILLDGRYWPAVGQKRYLFRRAVLNVCERRGLKIDGRLPEIAFGTRPIVDRMRDYVCIGLSRELRNNVRVCSDILRYIIKKFEGRVPRGRPRAGDRP